MTNRWGHLDGRRVEREYGWCVVCFSYTWWPVDRLVPSMRLLARECRACFEEPWIGESRVIESGTKTG